MTMKNTLFKAGMVVGAASTALLSAPGAMAAGNSATMTGTSPTITQTGAVNKDVTVRVDGTTQAKNAEFVVTYTNLYKNASGQLTEGSGYGKFFYTNSPTQSFSFKEAPGAVGFKVHVAPVTVGSHPGFWLNVSY